MTARVLLAVAVLLLMVPAPAQSHLTLLSSDPRDGARLAQAPSAVVLVFNKPLGATAYLRLNSSNQEGQQITNLKVVGSRITAALPPVGAGRFQLAYRAVSAQGHPLTGAISYSVGDHTGMTSATPNPNKPDASRSSALLIPGRVALAGAGLLSIGTFVVLILRRRRTQAAASQ